MTRDVRAARPSPRGTGGPGPSGRGAGPRRAPNRDPYGLLPEGVPLAAIVSVVGLLVIAVVTLNLLNGRLPFLPGSGGGPGQPPPVASTPRPSNVVVVPDDPRADVPGTIVYAKAGNVWVQSGRNAHQLTNGGTDSMPSFSPDGAWVYFVRTRQERGLWPSQGRNRYYAMTVPSLMRIRTSGGEAERLLDGKIRSGDRTWFGWIREPVVAPDGKTVALLTDLPDPTRSDVVLKLYDLETKKLTAVDVPETAPLGHQDPAWRPDGKVLLYVRNARQGSNGTPVLTGYTVANKRVRVYTSPGYLHPSWSPDGKYIAATRTSAFGTDVVILDATTGAEVVRLTDDGSSWAPAWSPRGDAVAFLHSEGQVVDLRMIELKGTGPSWTTEKALNLTDLSGLDSISRPDWFIPADQLPATPAPTGAPSAAPSGS